MFVAERSLEALHQVLRLPKQHTGGVRCLIAGQDFVVFGVLYRFAFVQEERAFDVILVAVLLVDINGLTVGVERLSTDTLLVGLHLFGGITQDGDDRLTLQLVIKMKPRAEMI